MGGEHVARTPIDSVVHVIDVAGGEWRAATAGDDGTAPSARIAPTLAVVGESIYVFGGRMGIDMDEGALGDLHRFDTAAGTWSLLESESAPEPRELINIVLAFGFFRSIV